MNFLLQGFRKLSSDRQTDRQTEKEIQINRQTDTNGRNYIARRLAGGEKHR